MLSYPGPLRHRRLIPAHPDYNSIAGRADPRQTENEGRREVQTLQVSEMCLTDHHTQAEL